MAPARHGAEDHFRHSRSQKGSIEFLGKPIQRMEADKIVRPSQPRAEGARLFRS